MTWSVKYNKELEIIEGVFSGPVSAAELREATSRRIALQKETGITKILNDVSEIELDLPIMSVLQFPQKHYPEEGADRKTRMALVMPKEERKRELAEFFITASLNRGWFVKPFESRQDALGWLLRE